MPRRSNTNAEEENGQARVPARQGLRPRTASNSGEMKETAVVTKKKVTRKPNKQNQKTTNPNQEKLITSLTGDVRRLADYGSCNVVHLFRRSEEGRKPTLKLENSLKSLVVDNLRKFQVYKTASPFDRRATALAWHPRYVNTVAVGSKGGDIVLWNYEEKEPKNYVMGQGPGGSVQAMKFDAHDYNRLYTVSIDGTLCSRDLMGTDTIVFLDTESRHQWFTALDVSFDAGLVVAGDNKGALHLLTKDGNAVWRKKLFSHKITHAEFSTRLPWLLATASLDDCIKLWDIRKIDDKQSALVTLPHEKAVNAAHFSLSHGTRILTTDQHSRISVFKGPLWDLETCIPHPHRQFQHLTPIKAYWHPLEDIVVVGRYPDPKFPGYRQGEARTVDFFDAATGEMLHQMQPRGHEGIISLNRFDHVGNALCSLMGQHILIWKPRFNESRESAKDDKGSHWKLPKRPKDHDSDDDTDLKKKKKKRQTKNQQQNNSQMQRR